MKNAINKTAMQLLLDKLDFVFQQELKNEMQWWNNLKKRAIETEKEQIMNDFLNGKMNVYDTKSISAEQYYEEKYKQYGLDNETRQILNNL